MSFSPLLSKRISQTQISQILLFVKAPSFFSSARWYIFILVPWVLYLKKVSRGFLEISSSTPNPLLGSFQTRCSHWKTSSLAQLLTVQRCSELLQIHFLTVTRFVLIHSTGLPLVRWSFISGNRMSPGYLLIDTCSPNPSQNDGVESYIFQTSKNHLGWHWGSLCILLHSLSVSVRGYPVRTLIMLSSVQP